MRVECARTSTIEQIARFEAQERELGAVGVEKVFAGQISSVASRGRSRRSARRLVLGVTKLDRLARSVADLCAIVKRIETKGAALWILAMNLDTATSTGRLLLQRLRQRGAVRASLATSALSDWAYAPLG
jgi:DNA invertase Pin-like site-specific DNA recombinase